MDRELCSPEQAHSGQPMLRIGEAAQRTGLSVKTIRFYCDQGLLRPAARSTAGYRLFDEESLSELVVIRALRAMDVPVSELSKILEVRRSGVCNCASLKTSLVGRINSIDERISELKAMKAELGSLLLAWRECGGRPLSGLSVPS